MISIRSYKHGDMAALRKIACDTADITTKNTFFLSDLLMNYYTEFEPESLRVAEDNNKPIGYLAGCLNTKRYSRLMIFYIIPKALLSSLFHGHFPSRLIIAGLKTIISGGLIKHIPLIKYPAHLHINIDKESRGQNIGRRLMEEFFQQVKQNGIPGIHLSTRLDNLNGRQFFEKMGFTLFGTHPIIIPEEKDYKKTQTAVYIRTMEDL